MSSEETSECHAVLAMFSRSYMHNNSTGAAHSEPFPRRFMDQNGILQALCLDWSA
jgi:hypothetical protein